MCIISLLFVMHCAQLVTYYVIADPDKFDFIELVDFDYEGNLPSFYSAIALFMAASLISIISFQKQHESATYKHHWTLLALIFFWLMLDEALGLHEELGDMVEGLNLFAAEGFLYFAWVVPYGVLLVAFAFSYLKFTLSLPPKTRNLFFLAGSLFITGAIGFEIISAREADLNGSTSMLYSTLYTIEELCEMLAIVLFIFALLDYIRAEYGEIRISFK
jgi:hypothetical protein